MARLTTIGVASGARDVADQKLEPEEQPAAQFGDAPVSWHGAIPDVDRVNGGAPIRVTDSLNETRAPLTRHVDAGQLALEQSMACSDCRHFDLALFQDKNPDRDAARAKMADWLLTLQVAVTLEAAEAMARTVGLCHKLDAKVLPFGSCGGFKPKDREAARRLAKKKDEILHAAAGEYDGRIIINGRGET